jgi:hypothetical protein
MWRGEFKRQPSQQLNGIFRSQIQLTYPCTAHICIRPDTSYFRKIQILKYSLYRAAFEYYFFWNWTFKVICVYTVGSLKRRLSMALLESGLSTSSSHILSPLRPLMVSNQHPDASCEVTRVACHPPAVPSQSSKPLPLLGNQGTDF